ncbi:hypothetical protein B0I35DRAFT_266370 [Stachybotrys elegans]|uniref:Uncharacterized protein n=1 Tax=Stachybotrys elegans TaxID=80388 RepID=A0A8K0SRI8_9HYPO|nr:hypothetical protein B0I35DRAFT_266370 [Stachybotrys elegans]
MDRNEGRVIHESKLVPTAGRNGHNFYKGLALIIAGHSMPASWRCLVNHGEGSASHFSVLLLDGTYTACMHNVVDFRYSLCPSYEWAASLEDLSLAVVINNAGGATERTIGTLEAMIPDRIITDASVNAPFPTLLLRSVIPLLQRNAPSLIINVGSLTGLGLPLSGSYSPSKEYLMKLTEVLGHEMRLKGCDIEVLGIRVGNVWGTG